MGKAIQQTQRGSHEAEEKPVSQDVRRAKRRSTHRTRNRDFSYQLFGTPPNCIAAPVPTKFAGENDVAGSIGSCRTPNCFAPTGLQWVVTIFEMGGVPQHSTYIGTYIRGKKRWCRREYAATDARVINWREAIAGRGQIAGLVCDGDRTRNVFLRGSECLRDVRGQGNQARKRKLICQRSILSV